MWERILGRETRPPDRQPRSQGPRHLWDHHAGPPIQESIVVYTDGTVTRGYDFESWEMEGDNIAVFIMGGSDFWCEDGAIKTALKAAGYTFEVPA